MKGQSERRRLDPESASDLAHWARKWGVTPDRVRDAAAKVGPKVDDIAAEIGEELYFSIRPQS